MKTYQGYTPDTTSEQATRQYLAKYGKVPQRIKRSEGAVLAGPIGGEKEKKREWKQAKLL